ncbi:MAG: YIP1 family protein [Firmicutes bacterium]|nr:YIP1 family protein [Bacillota bacterium]
MESIRNLARVVVKPSRVFEWIKENPVWWVPIILLVITSVIFAVVSVPLSIEVSQKALSSNSNISPEQAAQAKKMMESPLFSVIAAASAFIGTIIAFFVQSALLHLGAYIFGGRAKFSVGLATVGYAQIPIVIQQIIQSAYMVASGKIVVPGLSALLPSSRAATPLGVMLARIDVFGIWSIILLIIGFSFTYKITKTKAAAVTVGYWALGTIFAVLSVLLSMSFKPAG